MAIALTSGATAYTATITVSPSATRTVTLQDASYTVAGTNGFQLLNAAQLLH